jgi:hypothetical protein
MHGGFSKRVKADPQGCRGKYLDETPKKQALHHEIDLDAKRKRRKRGANAKNYVRPRELERVFRDRYGATLPHDDAGIDDLFVMANHLAHLDKPDKRIKVWVRRWAPWHGEDETAALIETVIAEPLKWTADKLAQRIGLNLATRTRLRITTIGAIDCGKAKRAKLRTKRNNEAKRAHRAEAGAAPHAASVEQAKPWEALGISRPTYFRRQKAARNETRETDSGTAYAKHIMLKPKQSQQATAAPPRGAVLAMLPPSTTGTLARVLVERIAANMRESIKLQSSLHTQFAPESFILTSRCA